MAALPIDLLIRALASTEACYVLGAGASAPDIPTMAQLPERLGSYASRLTSFPAGGIPDSPLRRLLEPLIRQALRGTTLEEWMPTRMTPAAIAVALEDTIAAAHWQPLPQYAVFGLMPTSATVISFNWDGLARARCHQRVVLHPHGVVHPRVFAPGGLDDLLDTAQSYDLPDAREWVIPGLVMPGEEEATALAPLRQRVFEAWQQASQIVVVGYSFGIGSNLSYDRVWLDTFLEACRPNRASPIHLVSPSARLLRGELSELLNRTVNVHAWPLDWRTLCTRILDVANTERLTQIAEFLVSRAALESLRALVERDKTATV